MKAPTPMNLRQILQQRPNKEGMLALVAWVGADAQRFDEVWQLMCGGDFPVDAYASWLMDHSLQQHPYLLLPYRERAMELLQKPLHNSIHRNLSKHLSRIPVLEPLEGPLYDLAIANISNPQVHVAIRVYSMEIAWNIARPWPELRGELQKVIEAHINEASAGFKSRGRKVLKRIEALGV